MDFLPVYPTKLMPLIDKSSAIPYYEQLVKILQSEIRTNQPDRGKTYRLPSENVLAVQHGITRATVRHALDVLEREGRIYREKGRGVFAVSQRVPHEMARLLSTTEIARQQGWTLVTKVISLIQAPASTLTSRALELDPDDPVYELKRLRVVVDGPLCLQVAYLPAKLVPLLEENDLTDSLYLLLETHYGLRLWTSQETLRARAATPREARLLRVRTGTPVMVTERVCFSSSSVPVEYLQAVWRSDYYTFKTVLERMPT